jgi:biopolymer transport protein ExbB/TolQ
VLFNSLQGIFAALAFALICERLWDVLFRRQIEAKPFIEAIRSALMAERPDAARRLVEEARPAWVAQFAAFILHARTEDTRLEIAIADAWQQLQNEISKGIYLVYGFARIASPLALLGVILQLAAGFGSRRDLATLQLGLAQSQAIEHALVTLTIGLATSSVCYVGGGILRKHYCEANKELEQMSSLLEDVFPFLDHQTKEKIV